MAQIGIRIVYFFSIFCFVETVSMEMSLDVIYDVLSSRIENVVSETNKFTSDLAEIKSTVNKIEEIQAYVVASMTDVKKSAEAMSESLINDTIKDVENRSESKLSDTIRIAKGIAEYVINDKIKLLQEVVQKFENKFTTFQTDIRSRMALINGSMESSVDLEQSLAQHKKETKTSLVLMNTHLQKTMNETGLQIEGIHTELRNQIKDSDIKMELAINKIRNETNSLERQQGKRVAFQAYGAIRQSNGTVQFYTVNLNEGSAYDSTSGIFTCKTEGLYHVSANMMEVGVDVNYIYCVIIKSGSDYVNMVYQQGSIGVKRAKNGRGAASGSGTFHLLKEDRVYVNCDEDTGNDIYWSSFSGVLVKPYP